MLDPKSAILSILASGALIALARMIMLAWRWRVGKHADIHIAEGICSLPLRYLRDVHAAIGRRPKNARMHASLAGGLLLTLTLAGALVTPLGGPISGWLLIASSVVAAYGVYLQAKRRLPKRPAHLSGGKWSALPFAFSFLILSVFLVVVEFLSQRSPPHDLLLIASTGAGIGSIGWLAWTIAEGPMRHAVAGAVQLACHPRPERFGSNRPDAALRTIDLEDGHLQKPLVNLSVI